MNRALFTALTAITLIVSTPHGAAAGDKPNGKYLITAPHTAAQCLEALDELEAHDKALLAKMDFGCRDGDHTGYLTVDAASSDAALAKLPPKARAGAKAVKLGKFTPEQIASFHKK